MTRFFVRWIVIIIGLSIALSAVDVLIMEELTTKVWFSPLVIVGTGILSAVLAIAFSWRDPRI